MFDLLFYNYSKRFVEIFYLYLILLNNSFINSLINL